MGDFATLCYDVGMRIAILAFHGCFAAEIFALADVLLIANRLASARPSITRKPFDVTIVGVHSIAHWSIQENDWPHWRCTSVGPHMNEEFGFISQRSEMHVKQTPVKFSCQHPRSLLSAPVGWTT